ncbi:MAG: diguanylate cyclase [Spirochaetes bacterium]|nr:diguanylate cyclase [Spirochaetota bacterium]
MKEITKFSLKAIEIMRHMLEHDVVEDAAIDALHVMELEYYSLIDKLDVLEQRVNVDEKTNLLKYKDDYVTMIVKTASRVLDRPALTDHFVISYIRFDLDDFSYINNKYGHEFGDEVLIKFASVLRDNSRPTDYNIRFGGEEFDVILPATDIDGALVYIDRIYDAFRAAKFVFEGTPLHVTVSAGISLLRIPYTDLKEIDAESMKDRYLALQHEVDDALYDSKLAGKNRYKVFDPKINYKKIRAEYAARGKIA